MTKEEVRAVVLSKLRLTPESVLWDIGAGTGSVTVEAALLASEGSVWAVERDPEAVKLIEQNKAKFDCQNLQIICGDAPGALEGLPAPDRVFIGGSRGKLAEILGMIKDKLNPAGRVVADFVVLENLMEALQAMEGLGFKEIEVAQVTVTKTRLVGGKHMMQAQNPVFILSGAKGLRG